MALQDIAKATITTSSVDVGRAGFSALLILGHDARFLERFRIYSGSTPLDDMIADGFTVDDPEYAAAAVAFSQRYNKPASVIIGRRDPTGGDAQDNTITITSAVDGFTYKLGLDQDFVEYTAGAADTVTTIRDALLALAPSSWPFTKASSSTDAITFTGKWIGVAFTFNVSANMTSNVDQAAVAPTETVDAALNAITSTGAKFFGLAAVSNMAADVAALVAYAEPRGVLFSWRTSSADVANAAITNDPASTFQDAARFQSYGIWHFAPWEFPDVSLTAGRLAVNLDEQAPTWELMTLPGVRTSPDAVLTSTMKAALKDKNVLWYEEAGGQPVVRNTKTAAGEWIDVVVGIAWLTARVQENAFSKMKGATLAGSKLDYTNEGGVAVLESGLRQDLNRAVASGFIRKDYTITPPDVDELPSATRATRELPAIQFNAQIKGAIHVANFTGVLTA